jgi:hypothetical protein
MGNEWSIKQNCFRTILIFSSLRAASLPIAIKSSVKQGMISVTSNLALKETTSTIHTREHRLQKQIAHRLTLGQNHAYPY